MKLWNGFGISALLLFQLFAQGMKKDLFLCGECNRMFIDQSALKKIAGVACLVCLPCWQKNEARNGSKVVKPKKEKT
jgi:transcription elongation factor Elf1